MVDMIDSMVCVFDIRMVKGLSEDPDNRIVSDIIGGNICFALTQALTCIVQMYIQGKLVSITTKKWTSYLLQAPSRGSCIPLLTNCTCTRSFKLLST